MSDRGRAAYRAMFDSLGERGQGAFVPFLVLGDPDPETSMELLLTLIASGADALELGLPFSDPIADGPVIQAAASRALQAGVSIAECWTLLETAREAAASIPIGLLVYSNLVARHGYDAFYRQAAEVGVDSVLVADVPVLEAEPFERAAKGAGVAPILIAPPNAPTTTLREIAARSEGYVYVVTRPGVTGADDHLREDSRALLGALQQSGAAPALLGFGISRPEHVRNALELGAAGAISGSAVVSHIPRLSSDRDALLEAVGSFIRVMKDATLVDSGTENPNIEQS